MSARELARLARAVQAGDRKSFRILVELLTRSLIAIAYRYTGDWETARDLSQETWLKVYQRIDRYDPQRPFRPWLFAVHRNACLSHLRLATTRSERLIRTSCEDAPEPPAPGRDPLARLEQQETAQRVRAAIPRLGKRQQRVFTLVDLELNDQREAARILGMNFGTLRATLHLARRRLAAILREEEDPAGNPDREARGEAARHRRRSGDAWHRTEAGGTP